MADVPPGPEIVPFDDLPHSPNAHRFAGRDHGGVAVSLVLTHAAPGGKPERHRHPYPEVFVVEAGEATFEVGDRRVVVGAGHVVVAPANVPHRFVNTGTGQLRVTSVHPSAEFVTHPAPDER